MVRATPTGVSAMIDPYGRTRASLGLGKGGVIDAVLPAPLPPTLYSRLARRPLLDALPCGAGLRPRSPNRGAQAGEVRAQIEVSTNMFGQTKEMRLTPRQGTFQA